MACARKSTPWVMPVEPRLLDPGFGAQFGDDLVDHLRFRIPLQHVLHFDESRHLERPGVVELDHVEAKFSLDRRSAVLALLQPGQGIAERFDIARRAGPAEVATTGGRTRFNRLLGQFFELAALVELGT